jgi:hypothetical protein
MRYSYKSRFSRDFEFDTIDIGNLHVRFVTTKVSPELYSAEETAFLNTNSNTDSF